MNRTGKTNAAKGVENHFNEYSEFHARELDMSDLDTLVNQTQRLDAALQEAPFKCWFEGCENTYVHHSRRVR